MKAFHLGAFEVMVVTDYRLSEWQPLPVLCVCVCVCVHVCVGARGGGAAVCPSAALSTEQPLMEPALWTRTHQRQQWRVTKTVRGAV